MPVEVHQGDVVTVVAQTAEHARQQRAAAAEDQQRRLRFGAPGDPLTQFGGQADDVFACHDARFVVTDRVAQAAAGVTEVDQRGPSPTPACRSESGASSVPPGWATQSIGTPRHCQVRAGVVTSATVPSWS